MRDFFALTCSGMVMPPAYRFGKPQRYAGSDLFFYPFPRAYALGYVRSPADAGSEFRSPTARKLIFHFRFIGLFETPGSIKSA